MRAGRILSVLFVSLFTLLGLNGCGSGTAAPVNPAPTVTLTANPTAVPPAGGNVTLTWTSTNATSATIDHGVGTVAASGTVTVKVTAATTFSITATGSGGTATATAAVTVSATAPTVTLTANPTALLQGANSTLTVTATNATSVVITNSVDSTSTPVTLTNGTGTLVVTPQVTTTYTATATGAGGSVTATATVTVTAPPPTVTITASPAAVPAGGTTTLTVTSTNATSVVISNNVDSTTFTLPQPASGTDVVTVTKATTYTATATGSGGTATATVLVRIAGSVQAVNHVLFMMQENRTFDTYFGMLNPYRKASVPPLNIGDDGKTYDVDGIDDKLSTTNVNDKGTAFPLFKTTSTCLDDMTSAWLESYGEVNRYNFTTNRKMLMDGFVHVAENFAASGSGSGTFTDLAGKRAMAYYDQGFLNYYYYMASQFALSDRWFSPVSSKSTPNRIATITGGTTQGLVRDPFVDDKLPTLAIKTIFEQLDTATPPVSWKIYYSLTEPNGIPDTTFAGFGYSGKYLTGNPAHAPCVAPLEPGNSGNTFCIDKKHIVPLSELFTDMTAGTLPSFAYIEAEYGSSDEHPGSGQSILQGQVQAADIMNALMKSPSWADSVFFLSYDEGGGPYDHVPPVAGHTNDNTDAALGITTDIGTIAVNPDAFQPCLANGPVDTNGNPTPTTHCDLKPGEPGTAPTDAATVNSFGAQLGFRLPNMVVSPFTRKHFVSHTPMDHTAVIKFVESRFIGPSASLTARDAAQPDLLEFFDFTAIPWSVPPTPPAPVTDGSLGRSTCTPDNMGP